MKKKLALALVAIAALTPLLATARHVTVRDPNDARGLLDLRRAEMVRGSPPKWRLNTYNRWSAAEMWDRGFALVYVDTFGGARADYYALVRSNGGRLVGSLYRDRENKRDARLRSVRAGHPSGSVINVSIPMSKLRRRDSRVYRWYTLTMFSGKRCKRFCFDRAPDNGTIAEPAPDPAPTTPTLPPTPTITP